MPSGRPHRRNDPSVMASVETAVSVVPRPGLIARIWHWRYELGLVTAVILGTAGIGVTLGPGWLITTTVAVTTVGAGALTWPASRRRLIARAWCVITPHRIRTGCTHAWVQTRDGRLPVVLYTMPADFGERVWLWCRAGITGADLVAARDILRAACWASDVRVVLNDRRSHIVVLEVIRRVPGRRRTGGTLHPDWPYPDRAPRDTPGQEGDADLEDPSFHSGLGHHWPLS
jgi:hypothetical protein